MKEVTTQSYITKKLKQSELLKSQIKQTVVEESQALTEDHRLELSLLVNLFISGRSTENEFIDSFENRITNQQTAQYILGLESDTLDSADDSIISANVAATLLLFNQLLANRERYSDAQFINYVAQYAGRGRVVNEQGHARLLSRENNSTFNIVGFLPAWPGDGSTICPQIVTGKHNL